MNNLTKNFSFLYELSTKNNYILDICEKICTIEESISNNKNNSNGNEFRQILECILSIYLIEKLHKNIEEIQQLELAKKIDLVKTYQTDAGHLYFLLDNVRISANKQVHTFSNSMSNYKYSIVDNIHTLKQIHAIICILFNLIYDDIPTSNDFNEELYYNFYDNKEKYKLASNIYKKDKLFVNHDININKTSIETYLKIPNAKLWIPIYQRKYEWSSENIDDLWLDIKKRAEDGNSHYFGTIAQKQENRLNNTQKESIKIIDGQQRLTTTILLVCAARDILIHDYDVSINDVSWLKEIYEQYNEFDEYVINPGGTQENNDAFRQVTKLQLNKNKIEEKWINFEKNNNKYFKNYFLLLEKFKELNNRNKILEYVDVFLKNFQVAEINLDLNKFSNKSELEIFNNLNSKGVSLSKNDLLKNFIFNICNDDVLNKHETDIVREYNSFLQEFNDNEKTLSKFYELIADLFYEEDLPKNENKQTEIIKESILKFLNIKSTYEVENIEDYYKIINKLSSYIKIYYDILDNKTTNNSYFTKFFNIQKIINLIQDSKKRRLFMYFIFVLKLFFEKQQNNITIDRDSDLKNLNIDCKLIQNLFLEIAKYIIRTQIVTQQGDSNIKRMLKQICFKILDENYLEYSLEQIVNKIIQEINEIYKNDNYSHNAFILKLENNTSHTAITPLLMLTEYVMHGSIFGGGEIVDRDDKSIEHILPQKYEKWLEEANKTDDKDYIQKVESYKEKIGNYLILSKSKNSAAKNELFNYKNQNIYKNLVSKLYHNNEYDDIDISRKNKWTFEDIDKRTNALIDYIKKYVITQ